MAIRTTAHFNEAESALEHDCYKADLGDGIEADFWVPRGTKLTSMDIFVEFEEKEEDDGRP